MTGNRNGKIWSTPSEPGEVPSEPGEVLMEPGEVLMEPENRTVDNLPERAVDGFTNI